MLGLATIFLTSFIVGLSGAMMPGPVLTIAVSETYKRGFWAGPLIVLGHAVLELGLVIGIVLGLGEILGNNNIAGFIGIAGGLFLFWMGYDIARSAIKKEIKLDTESSSNNSPFGPVLAGITVTISNPYWTIWWITVGAGFVIKSLKYKFLGLSVFYSGHIASDLIWYSFVSLAVVTGKKFLSDRIYRGILTACGIFLIGLAAFFTYSGIKFISF